METTHLDAAKNQGSAQPCCYCWIVMINNLQFMGMYMYLAKSYAQPEPEVIILFMLTSAERELSMEFKCL